MSTKNNNTKELVFDNNKDNKFRYASKQISKNVSFKLSDTTRNMLASYISYNVEITKELKQVKNELSVLTGQFDERLENQRKAVKDGMSNDEAIKTYPLTPIQNKIDAWENYKTDLKRALDKKCTGVYAVLYSDVSNLYEEYCKFTNCDKNTFKGSIVTILYNIGIQDKKKAGVSTYVTNNILPYIGVKDKTNTDTKRLTTAKSGKALYKTLTNVLIDYVISINEEYINNANIETLKDISKIKADNIK